MDLKGQKSFKVFSILMLIGGALGLLATILLFAGVGAAAPLLEGALAAAITSAYIWLAVAAVTYLAELAAGVVGFQAAKMPSVNKIKISLVLGLLVALLSLVGGVYSIITDGFTTNVLISLLLGLVIPVLYLFGLIQYKNALVALLSGE